MKKISSKDIILELIEHTDESVAQHMPLLFKWAKFAEKRVRSAHGYNFRAIEVQVNNFQADLPDDCLFVEKIIFDAHKDDLITFFRTSYDPLVNIFFTDLGTMDVVEHTWIQLGGLTVDNVLWQEEGNKIYFTDEFNGNIITIWYRCMDVDNDGILWVNESHRDALRYYMELSLAEKEKWRIFKSEKLLRNTHLEMIQDLRHSYHRGIRYARAEDDKEIPPDQNTYEIHKVR